MSKPTAICPHCGHEHEVFDHHQSLAGASRWAKVSPEKRKAILRKAAQKRWAAHNASKKAALS